MIFIAILLLIISLIMLIKPEVFWMIAESWKSNGDEPSSFYKFQTRIGGGIILFISILVIISWIMMMFS